MSSHSISQRAQRFRAAEQPFANSNFGPDGGDGSSSEESSLGNGWFDSSFELRKGLEVIEWVLPDLGPGKPTPS